VPRPVLPKPKECEGCPAYEIGKGYVPGLGPSTAEIAVVGQGPGSVEASLGQPFQGPIGQRMRQWLERVSINPHRVWLDNVCRCWLPGNRAPTSKERAHCTAAHTRPALRALPDLKVVCAVGLPASKSLLNDERLTNACVGTVERRPL
jgi:uracil-DNA glycosylase family 4